MSGMVKLNYKVLRQAWKNWLNFHHGLHCEELETRFFNYIHPDFEESFTDDALNWDADEEEYNVLPQTRNRLVALAGQHHYAIIKMYYANNPWKQS